MAHSNRPPRRKLVNVREIARRRFAARPDYRGVDIGYRWKDGQPTADVTVRIHVAQKRPLSELDASQVFPGEIEDVELDVIEAEYRTGRQRANLSLSRAPQLPYVMGGMSCSRVDGGSGTAGAIVIDNASGAPGILSNWHVLAGHDARCGDPVLSPGQNDGGDAQGDRLGSLLRWMLKREGDAAVALLATEQPWLPVQAGTFLPLKGVRSARLGEVLVKSGRSTGTTRARVDGEGTYRVFYETGPGVFEPQDIDGFKLVPDKGDTLGGEELSAAGDSGSIWMHEAGGVGVGLHFAGKASADSFAEHAIACHLEPVLAALDVRLATFEDLVERTSKDAMWDPRPEDLVPLTAEARWPDAIDPWGTIGPSWRIEPTLPTTAHRPHLSSFDILDDGLPAGFEGLELALPLSGDGFDGMASLSRARFRSRIDRIWHLLVQAMEAAGLGWTGMSIKDDCEGVATTPERPGPALARAINGFPALGLPRAISGQELGGFLSFHDVCWHIDRIDRGLVG